ncbi:MAG: peptidylprolyl isomerase [Anaerolineales bacterium]
MKLARFCAFCTIGILAACSWTGLSGGISGKPTETPTITATSTATPEPLAAKVNGEGITLEEFAHELSRYEKAQQQSGTDLANLGDYRHGVLNSMIEEHVAAQAAVASGRSVLDDQVDTLVESCRQARGGETGFMAWLNDNYYTLEEFRESIRRQLLVQVATDGVASQVPITAEQVHARHILVGNVDLANALLSQVTGGADFAKLVSTYSQDFSTRESAGDLGWFPRGVLTVPEVEAAAFSLQPGQTSQVVKSRLGYHIVQTLERESARALSPSALEILRRQAVEQWLEQQMQKANIEIFI